MINFMKYILYFAGLLVLLFEPFFFKFLALLLWFAAWAVYPALEAEWLYLLAQMRTLIQQVSAAREESEKNREAFMLAIEMLQKKNSKKEKQND